MPRATDKVMNAIAQASQLAPAFGRQVESADHEILRKARGGDEAAMRQLYETHAPVLHRRVQYLLPSEAEEIVQDAFVIAFSDLDKFRGDASIRTWLSGIAFNLARDRHKKRRRHARLEAALPAPERTGTPADASWREAEAVESLKEALRQLPHAQREAFVLRTLEGLSLEEASALLRVRKSTLSYRALKAQAAVRAHLTQEKK